MTTGGTQYKGSIPVPDRYVFTPTIVPPPSRRLSEGLRDGQRRSDGEDHVAKRGLQATGQPGYLRFYGCDSIDNNVGDRCVATLLFFDLE